LVELVLHELVDGGIRYEVARVSVGDVEDGGGRVDVLVVIPEVDVDWRLGSEGEPPAVEDAPGYHAV